MWTYNYTYSDELYHHGIKGMKWGVRRFQNKDGTRTAAGKKRYADNNSSKNENEENSNSEQTKKKGLTDKQKKAIKVGAIVAGTALAAYGSYKIYQAYTGSNQKVDPNTGFRLLDKDMTTNQHLDAINPGRIRLFSKGVKNKEIINGSSYNCMLCTTSYELRKRGFDVHAGYSNTGYMPDELFSKIYKDYKGTTKLYSPDSELTKDMFGFHKTRYYDTNTRLVNAYKNISDAIEKEGPGSRGNIIVWWKQGGGHSMIWENVDGVVKFMDGQTGKEYKNFTPEILRHINLDAPIELLRTDNMEINIPEMKNVINSDTLLKTYVDHGAEITARLVTDPRIAIPAYAAVTTATSVGTAATSYKKENKT